MEHTTVGGEKCPMRRGDLILTPTGLWHEHGHDGSEPVVWLEVEDQSFTLGEADTCCAPGYRAVTLHNRSSDKPTFIFIADESPLHRKLGVFENRG